MILVTIKRFYHFAFVPANLHINVSVHYNHGVGATLIEAFAAQASTARAPGMHIVTNEGAAIFASRARRLCSFGQLFGQFAGCFHGPAASQNCCALVDQSLR